MEVPLFNMEVSSLKHGNLLSETYGFRLCNMGFSFLKHGVNSLKHMGVYSLKHGGFLAETWGFLLLNMRVSSLKHGGFFNVTRGFPL